MLERLANISPMLETNFKNKDVRKLRERLVWVYKQSPNAIKNEIDKTLKEFAIGVSEYCKCEERSFIQHEQKHACLNCGKRHNEKAPQSIEG